MCEGTRAGESLESKVGRAIKPSKCKTAMAARSGPNRYRASIAKRSNRMRLCSHELTLESRSPIVCNVHARLRSRRVALNCAVHYAALRARARAAQHTCRESLDNKEIGSHDMASGWNFGRVFQRRRSPRGCSFIAGKLVSRGSRDTRARDVPSPLPRRRRLYARDSGGSDGPRWSSLIFFVNICRLPPARRKSWEFE